MSESEIMHQFSCNRILSDHCEASSLILSGSQNWDAVEVALDRGFVEGVTRSADSEVMHDPGIAVGWDVLHY